MLLPGIVAATLMFFAGAIVSIDTPVGKSALYAYYRWQRRRRRARRSDDPVRRNRLAAAVTS